MKTLEYPLKCSYAIGALIRPNLPSLYKYFYHSSAILVLLMTSAMCALQLIYVLKSLKDIASISDVLFNCIMTCVTTYKLFLFYIKRQEINKLVKFSKQDVFLPKNEEELQLSDIWEIILK